MRLIDADVLKQDINKVSTHWLNEWSTLGVLAMVDKQPTVDAVPVVRCKDCKYYQKAKIDIITPHGMACAYAIFRHFYREPDGYCSKGERKGGDE